MLIENVPVVLPAAMVRLLATDALALDDERETRAPPAGAAAASVTVPVADEPPFTELGETEIDAMATARALIVSVVEADLPPADAEMALCPSLARSAAVTVNVALVWPALTVRLDGTDELLSDSNCTAHPLVPAARSSVTVAVDVEPPSTLDGDRASDDGTGAGAVTVRAAVFSTPFADAVMVAAVSDDTVVVVMSNVASLAPAAIVTL